MPASVTIGPAWWMDGPTYNGAVLRPVFSGLLLAQAAQVMSGVLPGGGALAVSAGSGMSVNVATGTVVIASSAGVTNGGYAGTVLTGSVLTVAGSDAVNPRIDLVCATVTDVGSSASAWSLQVVTGTAAPSPSAPAVPSNSLALATVLVPAGSSSVSGGNITDQRVFTACQGGIVPVPDLSGGVSPLTGYQGLYVHDRATTRLARLTTGGSAVQPNLLPFVPVRADLTGTRTSATAPLTILSCNVTTDGSTDIECVVKWPGLTINAAWPNPDQPWGAMMELQVDGVPVYEQAAAATATTWWDAGAGGGFGGGFSHVTQSGTDRPSAGAHVVTVVMVPRGDGTHTVNLPCTALSPASLYVRAAPL